MFALEFNEPESWWGTTLFQSNLPKLLLKTNLNQLQIDILSLNNIFNKWIHQCNCPHGIYEIELYGTI